MHDKNIYSKIIDGSISPQEKAQLQKTGEWDEIQSILAATDDLYVGHFNQDESFQKLIAKRDRRNKTSVFRILRPYLQVAAALVPILIISWFLLNQNTTIEAPLGKSLSYTLPDNSSVIINAGSKIEYSKKFNKNREVVLEGEAFFEVEKGSKFSVKTDLGIVSVLGTQFNVNTWNDDLVVSCYEGRVEWSQAQKSKVLSAGESIRVNKISQWEEIRIENEEPFWINGNSKFDNVPLLQVFEELERQYHITIVGKNLNNRFRGMFPHDNLDLALKQICVPMGLKYNIIDNDKVEILR